MADALRKQTSAFFLKSREKYILLNGKVIKPNWNNKGGMYNDYCTIYS